MHRFLFFIGVLAVAVVAAFSANMVWESSLPAASKRFTIEESEEAVLLKKMDHNQIACSEENILSEGPGLGEIEDVNYFVYEYTGEEPPFKGDFRFSSSMVKKTPLLKIRNTLKNIKVEKMYFIKADRDLVFECNTGIIESVYECGNGIMEGEQVHANLGINHPSEECDDGNTEDKDGCDSKCKVEIASANCGNGELDEGEECDAGNSCQGDRVCHTCRCVDVPPSQCGDGICDENEKSILCADPGPNQDTSSGKFGCHPVCREDCETKEQSIRLAVVLSSSKWIGDTVAKGSTNIKMLSIGMGASCDSPIEITHLTITHKEKETVGDIENVYASINGIRVTGKQKFDPSNQEAKLTFGQKIQIEKCKNATIDILADINPNAVDKGEHTLLLQADSDIEGNMEDTTGSFPIKGNTFRTANVASGIVEIKYLQVPATVVKAGDEEAVLGRWELSADETEDQISYVFTLKQSGTLPPSKIKNAKIRRTDHKTVISKTIANPSGNLIRFEIDPPFAILDNNKVGFEVVGDIQSDAVGSIIMGFEEPSDAYIVSIHGYGVNDQLYGSNIQLPNPSNSPSVINIDSGNESMCGDGNLDKGEGCDDGNKEDGDGCDSNCKKRFVAGCPAFNVAPCETGKYIDSGIDENGCIGPGTCCGNNYCEGKENENNCEEDCEKTEKSCSSLNEEECGRRQDCISKMKGPDCKPDEMCIQAFWFESCEDKVSISR